jgi:hypothetical protein
VRNNVLYVTASGDRLALLDQSGRLVAMQNWMKTGWVESHGGDVNVVDNGQVTGSSPGFVNEANDNFELISVSPCIDQAAPLHPAVLPQHRPTLEYVRHQMSRPRPDDGDADIGAYEFSVGTGILITGDDGAEIRILRNPFTEQCEIMLPESMPVPHSVDVLDITGRSVAHFSPAGPGRWIWAPDARTRPGAYFIRAGRLSARAIYIR